MSVNSAAAGASTQQSSLSPAFAPPPPSAPPQREGASVVVVYQDTPFELLTFPVNYKLRKRVLNILGGLATLLGGAGVAGSMVVDLNRFSPLGNLIPIKESMRFALVFIPSALLALLGIGLLFAASRVIAYNDQATWNSLRQKAARFSFKDLIDSFGFDNLRNYNLLSLPDLQAKYRAWVADSSAGETLNLYDLQEHGIISADECSKLNTLLTSAKRAFDAGEKVEHLKIMEQFYTQAGFVKGRAEKRERFRKELQPLALRNVFSLYRNLWKLAEDGRLNSADYERLIDLKARWDRAGNKDSEKLKLQSEFERHFKGAQEG